MNIFFPSITTLFLSSLFYSFFMCNKQTGFFFFFKVGRFLLKCMWWRPVVQ